MSANRMLRIAASVSAVSVTTILRTPQQVSAQIDATVEVAVGIMSPRLVPAANISPGTVIDVSNGLVVLRYTPPPCGVIFIVIIRDSSYRTPEAQNCDGVTEAAGDEMKRALDGESMTRRITFYRPPASRCEEPPCGFGDPSGDFIAELDRLKRQPPRFQSDEPGSTLLSVGLHTLVTGGGSRTLAVFNFRRTDGSTSQNAVGAVRRSDRTSGYREQGAEWQYDGRYLRLNHDRTMYLCHDGSTASLMATRGPQCEWSIASTDGGRTFSIRSDSNRRILVGRYLELRMEQADVPGTAQLWEVRN